MGDKVGLEKWRDGVPPMFFVSVASKGVAGGFSVSVASKGV
jgi:hypothetical protein